MTAAINKILVVEDDDRRQQPERRGHHYSFKFVSVAAVEELRKWLEEICGSGWNIGIPDRENGTPDYKKAAAWGNFRAKFENQDDLANMIKMMGVYWPPWMG